MDILAEEKKKTVKLADGKDYILPAINMTTLANVEKTMGIGGKSLIEKMNTEPMNTLRLFTHALLHETNPSLTIEEVGKLITIKELTNFSETISILMALG